MHTTNLVKESLIEVMIITVVKVTSCQTSIPLEGAVVADTPNDSGRGRVRSSSPCLSPDAKKVGDEVSI